MGPLQGLVHSHTEEEPRNIGRSGVCVHKGSDMWKGRVYSGLEGAG